jgi:hypothetical protein
MGLFALDPESIAARAKRNAPFYLPTFAQSIARGVFGFTLVSVAGFLPWVLAGNWFYSHSGEVGLYVTCAVVFVALSGVFLHKLIIGPESLKRFYLFFSVCFGAYAVVWIAVYLGSHDHLSNTMRSVAALFAATAVMGLFFGVAFEALAMAPLMIVMLFVLNSAGYFIGGWIEGYLGSLKELNLGVTTLSGPSLHIFMKAMWGVCYGIGFGAGLGAAFYASQRKARALLSR